MDAKIQIQQLLTQLSIQDKLILIEQIVHSIRQVEAKEVEPKVIEKEHPILEMAGIWSEETAAEMEDHLSDARKIDHDEW